MFVASDSPRNNKGAIRLYWEMRTPLGVTTAKPDMWFGHGKTATILFADGHVAAMTEREVPVYRNRGEFRQPGFARFWASIRYRNGDTGKLVEPDPTGF